MKKFLRGLFGGDSSGTAKSVPFSLDMSQSYKAFEIQCLQHLNSTKTCDTFSASLGHGFLLKFENGIVSVSKSQVIASQEGDRELEHNGDEHTTELDI